MTVVETRYHHARLTDMRQTDSGGFAGYGSVHNVTDTYGTRMMPGCWRSGGLDSEPYAMLWMHDPTQVLGTFRAREDDQGLWIEGTYDQTDLGQRARAQALSGSAPGLSVGFNVDASQADDENALTSCRLVEVSQITARMASTPGAALASVRSAVNADAQYARTVRLAVQARARLLLTD